jgi:hypothetical protein
MTTLADWTAAMDAAIIAQTVTLNEDAGTTMSWIWYTDPAYEMDTLMTAVGLTKAAGDWEDSDWQATVTLADQTEGSDKTSSWTCRITATGFDATTAEWGSLDQKFQSAAAATVNKKPDGIITQSGTWTETTTWITSEWKEELSAAWEAKMAEMEMAEGDGAEGDMDAEGDDEGEADDARRLQDEVEGEGDEVEGEGDDAEGDVADDAEEAEPSLIDQYKAAMEDEETWGFSDMGEGNWSQWCAAYREPAAMSDDDFALAAGDIGVTVTWTNIDAKGKAAGEPIVTSTTVTLAKTELPSLAPPAEEEDGEDGEGGDEAGDSATFIKATSVALGAFAVMLA